jgi:hypothetical protein
MRRAAGCGEDSGVHAATAAATVAAGRPEGTDSTTGGGGEASTAATFDAFRGVRSGAHAARRAPSSAMFLDGTNVEAGASAFSRVIGGFGSCSVRVGWYCCRARNVPTKIHPNPLGLERNTYRVLGFAPASVFIQIPR